MVARSPSPGAARPVRQFALATMSPNCATGGSSCSFADAAATRLFQIEALVAQQPNRRIGIPMGEGGGQLVPAAAATRLSGGGATALRWRVARVWRGASPAIF